MKKCSVPECNKKSRYNTPMVLCQMHYFRLRNTGKLDKELKDTWINSRGYVIKTINCKNVLYHRYLMENYLGRKLNKNETIHHINRIKTDNRIENFLIVTNSEHHKFHIKKRIINWQSISVPLGKANRWHPREKSNCLVCSKKAKYRSLCEKHFVSWSRWKKQFC